MPLRPALREERIDHLNTQSMKPRRRHRFCRIELVSVVIAPLLAACGKPAPQAPEPVGRITHPAARETSGLAASHRTHDLLWSDNDSGGQPVLYGIGIDGHLRGTVRVAGVKNIDWEDLASFELDGQA